MSEKLLRAHSKMGEPMGESADISDIYEWAGDLILSGYGVMTEHQLSMLRDIGEYLHAENPNMEQRKHALSRYFDLYDSITGR